MTGYLPKPPLPLLARQRAISKNIVLACPMYESVIGDIHDVSGKNHNSTSIDGNPVMSGSAYGQALDLDSANPDGIEIANHADFVIGDGTIDSPYSWFIQFKPDDLDALGVILSKDDVGTREWLIYYHTDGSVRCLIFEDDSPITRIGRITDVGAISAGSETSLLVTYDGSAASSGLKFYLNGLRADTTDSNNGSYTANGDDGLPVRIGLHEESGSPIRGMDGTVSNVVLWKNRELTANDAQMLHHDPFLMYRRPNHISEWIAGTFGGGPVSGLPWARYGTYLKRRLLLFF